MANHSSLSGKRILVTRASFNQQTEDDLTSRLTEKGASVVEKPLLSIDPPSSYEALDRELNELNKFDWIVFASPRAVESVISRLIILFNLTNAKEALTFFQNSKVAVVGKSTANCLKNFGIKVDFQPKNFSANDLVKEFPVRDLAGLKIFWPRTLAGESTIHDGLQALGARVIMAEAYSSNLPKSSENLALELANLMNSQLDVVTFTSSQTIRNFVSVLESQKICQKLSDRYPDVIVAVIGPKTAQTAIEIYGKADVVAGEYTIEGLVSSLERFLQHS
ncbi:MAG: uroporphyrinogen-III synthase [Cyanobacteria bacterium TGS_CYA1]|nr:uroporphyrinogen-III synthase [Cyanobacteria bacterium TGS_CYA1]